MTLQPPPGYEPGAPEPGYDALPSTPQPPTPAPVPSGSPEAVSGPRDRPDAQLGNPDGAWLRVISRAPSPIHLDDGAPSPGVSGSAGDGSVAGAPPNGLAAAAAPSVGSAWGAPASSSSPGDASSVVPVAGTNGDQDTSGGPLTPAAGPAGRPAVIPARRRPSRPPFDTNVVGGRTVKLHRVAALDRLASGIGFLSVEWLVRQRGFDLLALQDGSVVAPRGNALTIDMTQPMNRVLISTGTQGTMPIAPSELRVSNGSTQVIVPIDGGTSLGVWPRLTLTRVDEFVVIRHERDPLSGTLSAVAGAYGYDERSFVITHTHLLG